MERRAAALGVIVLAVAASAGATTIITFDDSPVGPLAKGTVLTDQYASLGVKFTGFENGVEMPTYVDAFWDGQPAGNYWTNDNSSHMMGNDRRDVIEARFLGPVSNVGFEYISTWSIEPAAVNLYDSSDTLIGRVSLATDSWVALDLSSYSNIAYIQLLQPWDHFTLAVDNLRFDFAGATVPAPAALALSALGAGLVGRLRRSRTL
ncbi:MAG: hypothetical protein ABFE01_29070 [Phycisphaerales bacterium]